MKPVRVILLAVLLLLITSHTAADAQTTARSRAEGLFAEAQKALSQADDERAESLLKQALGEDPSFTSSIWQLAQIYEKRGKLEHARELLIRGIQKEPQATWARDRLTQLEAVLAGQLLSEAKSLMQSGRYDQAIPKLSLYLDIKPYDPVPLLMIGRCHLALGSLDTAKGYIEQAVQRDPSNPDAAQLLREVETRLARAEADQLIRRASDILDSYTPEHRDEALEALLAVLAADPQNDWAKEKIAEIDAAAAEPVRATAGDKGGETRRIPFPVPSGNLLLYTLAACLAALAVCIVLLVRQKSRSNDYPLCGNLSLIPILDVVALVHSNLKSGKLVVTASNGKGEIFFYKGEIIHARWKDIDGKKAFNRIMEQRCGTYFFSSRVSNRRKTIEEPLSMLLLSMNRDENNPGPSMTARESVELITKP
jgi:tetratricopeptide (TPR) repeat protein